LIGKGLSGSGGLGGLPGGGVGAGPLIFNILMKSERAACGH
jgi:hypothetical protein